MLKNVTLNADEVLIKKAREHAKKDGQSLNTVFREWLSRYAGQEGAAKNYETLMKKLNYAKAGGKFTRVEMNER